MPAVRAIHSSDRGGRASRLVDALLDDGYRNLTVLDLSKAALAASRERLGLCGETVTWVAADVTTWGPSEHYGVWHDRAAFHFLTDEKDRHAYVLRLEQALREGGEAIIGTFALNGPERCSGLPMMRYDSSGLTAVLGPKFRLLASREAERRTPWGASQVFQFSRFSFSLAQSYVVCSGSEKARRQTVNMSASGPERQSRDEADISRTGRDRRF